MDLQQGATAVLQRLIRFNTVNPPGNEQAAQEFLKEVPFTLVLVEFDGVDTLFLSRLVGVERADIRIGLAVKAKFRRKATWTVRDVYFVRAKT